jgi:hypothetical protein
MTERLLPSKSVPVRSLKVRLQSFSITAVALQPGLVVVGAPRTDVVALTPRTWEGPILPAQHMDIGLTRFGVEEVVKMRHNQHG